MSRKNGRNATPTLPSPKLQSAQFRGGGVVELTEEEARLLIQIVRATPDKLMMQMIHAMPAELLMQVIRETPVQGNLQSLPTMLARLVALQEKLGKRLKIDASSAPTITAPLSARG